ncbi:MAG: DUF3592 domain-containing protein [Pirellulaceae bacterium]
MILGLIFTAIGIAACWFITVNPWINTLRARDWPIVDCTITGSSVGVHRGDDSTSYSADISFRFNVGQQTYYSDTFSFYNSSGKKAYADEIVARHPVGFQTTCYYNPGRPERAVIDPAFQWHSLWGTLFLLFLLFGLPMMYSGIVGTRRSRAKRPASSFSGVSSAKKEAAALPDIFSPEWEGPQRLKPETTRLGRFAGIAIGTLIWNGIVVAIIWAIWSDEGKIGVCIGLFLLPFVIAGVLLMGGAIHQLLALTNPLLEIALSNGAVAPGQNLDVAWECTGNASRFDNITITMEGSEHATYVRGTDTVTDVEIFQTVTIAEVTDSDEMEFGSRSIVIPVDAIHSFESRNNKIIWLIKVHGNIRWWPDVKETFPFRVKPA